MPTEQLRPLRDLKVQQCAVVKGKSPVRVCDALDVTP